MSKPTNKPGWNPTDSSKIVEPTSTKKAQGWAAGEKPAAEHFNWLMKTVSQWIDHIDAEGVQGPKGDTGPAGPQGPKGDTGPAGAAGGISEADLARIAALEAATGTIAPSPVTVTFPYNGGAAPSEYDAGAVIPTNAKTINWANGASQYMLLDADCALSFSNPVAGNTYYLRIQQSGYGLKRVIAWPTNIIWNSGSVPTISTAAWTVDVIGCYFDGTNYYGYVSQGHFTAPSAIDVKNGYIAGGGTGGSNGGSYVRTVEKLNFNSDTTLSIVQTEFGYILNSTGSYVDPTVTSHLTYGQGTQSSTHGYRNVYTYSGLPTVNSQSTIAMSKLQFSNDTGAAATIRPTASLAWTNGGRRGIIQSSSAAYNRWQSTTYGKFTFSTDIASDLTVSLSTSASGYNTELGFSTETNGVLWGVLSGSNLVGYRTLFSTDTNLALAAYYASNNNTTGGWNEGVDGAYNGYSLKQTTAGPVSSCYKVDKVSDNWNVLSATISAFGPASAATQGNAAGYFCGGQNETTLLSGPTATKVSNSQIKKILYSPETLSLHSVSLTNSRHFAAGFEG